MFVAKLFHALGGTLAEGLGKLITMKAASTALLLAAFLIKSVTCQHPGDGSLPVICDQKCPSKTPFRNVSIREDRSNGYIETSICPPYDNKNWTNPNDACLTPITYKIPLKPKVAAKPIPVGKRLRRYKRIFYLRDSKPVPIFGALGVLLNGVPVFGMASPCVPAPCKKDGAPSNTVDAVESEGHTFDFCGGHASPYGQYHVHSGMGFATNAQRVKCKLPEDTAGSHSELLGWMFDGYGLYGINSLGGVPPDDLDRCRGHSHKINGTDTYHYHLPNATFPWTIGCYKGCPEVSNNPEELRMVNRVQYGCRRRGSIQSEAATRAGAPIVALFALMTFATCLIQ